MREYQKDTIKYYDENVNKYIEETIDLMDVSWLTRFADNIVQKGTVLDVGCGYGRDCKFLADKGFATTGIDLSEKMIESALESVHNADFKVMDMLDLKFEDASFDGVWCSATLYHLSKQDIPVALNEITRVLKKKGVFYLFVEEGEGEEVVAEDDYKRFYSFFGEKELKELLMKHFEMLGIEIRRSRKGTKGYIHVLARKV